MWLNFMWLNGVNQILVQKLFERDLCDGKFWNSNFSVFSNRKLRSSQNWVAMHLNLSSNTWSPLRAKIVRKYRGKTEIFLRLYLAYAITWSISFGYFLHLYLIHSVSRHCLPVTVNYPVLMSLNLISLKSLSIGWFSDYISQMTLFHGNIFICLSYFGLLTGNVP